jgi:mRNA-degrading endonuclease YafQ of YafQ-DinJ toxin-antitoxin module
MQEQNAIVIELRRMEEALLRGAARDAVVPAGALCEAALKQLLGEPPDARLELGPGIGRVHREGLLDRSWLRDLNRLKEHRNRCAHHPPRTPLPTLDDAERVAQVATRLLEHVGLMSKDALLAVQRSARQAVCGQAPSECMKLDRSAQRARLADLLNPPPTLLVLLTHGEVGQGHEHFGRFASLKLRNTFKGRWRQASVTWPAPSLAPGNRLGLLGETLLQTLGLRRPVPPGDPYDELHAPAWNEFFKALCEQISSRREMILLRHTIHRPHPQDAVLLRHYLERAWTPLRETRLRGTVVLIFEVVRAEQCGLPLLSRGWRLSQGEKRATDGLLAAVDGVEGGPDIRLDALDELTSLDLEDVANWLRTFRGMPRTDAEREAHDLLATSRGGRFEILVQQLASI